MRQVGPRPPIPAEGSRERLPPLGLPQHDAATRGTGCGFDNTRTWTSETGDCAAGQHMSAAGNPGSWGTTPPEFSSYADPHTIRGCADAVGGGVVGARSALLAREARGHGVPEVMKAVAVRGGVIRARLVGVKALASALTIGTGGSVGRGGAVIQIGSAFGSHLGQWLKLNAASVRTLVGCGAAAGISATFNAPIAGAIFAAEIIVGDFAVTQFTPIVISSVVASVATRYAIGNHPAFIVPDFEIVSPFELVPYMGAGIVAGLVAVAFIRTLSFAEDNFAKIPVPEWSTAAIGGAMVGTMAIWLPNVYGVGYTTIGGALAGTMTAGMMGVLVVAKILATSVTIGSGGSGGVFAPSLFLGAMAGGVVGTLVEQYFPGATGSSGAYALVTMGAVVAAATHAPVSAIIIIFELTQTIDIIPALMTACVISTLVAQVSFRDSIYTVKLRRQGIDFFEAKNPNVLKELSVRDVIVLDPVVVPAAADFKTVLDLVVHAEHGIENVHGICRKQIPHLLPPP